MERRYEATSYARNFLQQRIAAVKAKLEESERALVAYAQKQGIITLAVDTGGAGSARQEQSIDAATLVQNNNALAAGAQRPDRRRAALSPGVRRPGAASAVISDPTVQALQQQRAALEAQYQQKLALFKPEFPEMVQLRNQIDTLAKEIATQRQQRLRLGLGHSAGRLPAAVARERALEAKVNENKAA